MKRNYRCMYLAVAFAAMVWGSSARAGYVVNIDQVGNNVVAVGSGSFTLAGAAVRSGGSAAESFWVEPGEGQYISMATSNTFLDMNLSDFSGPTNFGTQGRTYASSGTGDNVGIFGSIAVLRIPFSQYLTPGTPMQNTTTWVDATLASLGLTSGSYTWTWGSGPNPDTFTINVNAVPEPSVVCLLIVGASLLILMKARKRAANSVSE